MLIGMIGFIYLKELLKIEEAEKKKQISEKIEINEEIKPLKVVIVHN